jgi:hypothetical protein
MRNIFYEYAVLVGSLEKAGRKTNPGRKTTWTKVGTGNQIDVSTLDEVRHTDGLCNIYNMTQIIWERV